ncbi:Sugar phosphate isomerase/epimerase [Actinopolyspora xinjiangensis]|uniref:Sugar phosphate isomerase/epimerase n=1 Tax=Actinopolyspora xinjiangensis TaxID=405564 RepID=A0A1H0RPA9_9ACTN|nr:sugar phosphate isomerase/epimerase [Actinopolyspora xinjiangensis]SDP31287.1 Sugar phosphate isomerase/epimerase [Actinopolyspora xinjiangensis]
MHGFTNPDRRAFLRGAGATALAMGASSVGARTALAGTQWGHGPHLPPSKIGIQLYTMRDMMSESVVDTLSFLSEVGYSEVEFAGLHGHTPERVHDLLRELRLRTPAGHEDIPTDRDRLERILHRARTLGQRWVVLPWFSADDLASYQRLAERLNWAGELARGYGLRIGYHNHAHEFRKLAGKRPYDVLLDETDRRLVDFEVDLYWVVKAGVDPLELFERAPRRFPLAHVKGMAPDGSFADLGEGVIDYERVLAARNRAGIRHFFVERDDQPHPRETAKEGYHYLRHLGC